MGTWYGLDIFKENETISIGISIIDRLVQISCKSGREASIFYTYELDVLYDLILADLLERVRS